MDWDEIIGKLMIHGFTPQQIGDMTLKQVHQAIDAIVDDMKWQVRLSGGEIDETVNEVYEGNADMLEAIMNASIRGSI